MQSLIIIFIKRKNFVPYSYAINYTKQTNNIKMKKMNDIAQYPLYENIITVLLLAHYRNHRIKAVDTFNSNTTTGCGYFFFVIL